MKHYLPSISLFLFCLSFSSFCFAQQPTLVWAKRMGGTTQDFSPALTVDAAGNAYTTGFFEGTADFDPGAGVYNLTSAGGRDIYISKLDASGNFIWARRMGGVNLDQAYSIALDASQNLYINGDFDGTVDFDPGMGTQNLTANGATDIFVSKFDSSGSFIWAKNIGGTLADEVRSLTVGTSGNVYITGIFYSTVDFDPGTGISNLTSTGAGDIFISKLDASGGFLWAKNMGGAGNDFGNSVAVDNVENVYTTGYFTGIADFDPAVGINNLTSNGAEDRDIFVSKLDASGNFVWAKNMGGTIDDIGLSIDVDAAQNVYTTGYFDTKGDFDPGPGIHSLTSVGVADIFISKLDASGNFAWAKNMGSAGKDFCFSIVVDASGNVFTTGVRAGFRFPATDENIFTAKFTGAGNLIWTDSIGGLGKDRGYSMGLDAAGNLYIAGVFSGTADFDPGPATANTTSAGNYDIFVLKLGQQPVLNDYTWTGSVDNNWNNAANWNCNCIPPLAANVTIPAGGNPTLNSAVTVGNISLQGTINIIGYTITINGAVTGTGTFAGSASSGMIINGNAGTLRFSPSAARLRLLEVNTGASVTVPEGTLVVGPQ
jgi:hypothetical protein